jgi:hypothetical protein
MIVVIKMINQQKPLIDISFNFLANEGYHANCQNVTKTLTIAIFTRIRRLTHTFSINTRTPLGVTKVAHTAIL